MKKLSSKLGKFPKIENKIVGWIIAEPSISDYAICRKLKEEEGFSISQPSISSWRKTNLKSLMAEYERERGVSGNGGYIDMKMEKLHIINDFIDDFRGRSVKLKRILPDYTCSDGTSGNPIWVGISDLDVESLYQNNAKFITYLLQERDKIIGNLSPYDIAEHAVQSVLQLIARYFNLDKESGEYAEFLESLNDLEETFKDKYAMKRN